MFNDSMEWLIRPNHTASSEIQANSGSGDAEVTILSAASDWIGIGSLHGTAKFSNRSMVVATTFSFSGDVGASKDFTTHSFVGK